MTIDFCHYVKRLIGANRFIAVVKALEFCRDMHLFRRNQNDVAGQPMGMVPANRG